MPDQSRLEKSLGPTEAVPITMVTGTRWYGWQLILSDLSFFALGRLSKEGAGAVTASVGLSLGAPILHFANGNRLVGFGSLCARLSIIVIAGALGASWNPGPANCHDDVCKDVARDVATALALVVGTSFALLDDLVLARVGESSAPGGRTDAARPVSGRMLAPVLAPTPGGAAMALVGTF